MTTGRPRVRILSQFGVPVRGVSPYADQLLAALEESGEVDVSKEDFRSPYPQSLHPGGAYRQPDRGDLRWFSPRSWRRLATADYEVLHIQHWMQPLACYLWPLTAWAKRNGKRVIVTVHNPQTHERIPLLDWLEVRFLRSAELLVVHDDRAVSTIRNRLGEASPEVRCIPHGVSTRRVTPVDCSDYHRVELDPARRYFCMFGNLRGYKGVAGLLEAWSALAPHWPQFDLVIAGRVWSGGGSRFGRMSARLIGSAREATRIENMLRRPSLAGRVHWREGFQPDEDLDALIKLSDFAVFPYERFASQSGAASRAAGAGCPVLVTDVGGLPMLAIDSDWVLPPKNLQCLIDALERRFREALEPGTVCTWRKAQRLRVASYAWSVVASAHNALYLELGGSVGRSRKHWLGNQ